MNTKSFPLRGVGVARRIGSDPLANSFYGYPFVAEPAPLTASLC